MPRKGISSKSKSSSSSFGYSKRKKIKPKTEIFNPEMDIVETDDREKQNLRNYEYMINLVYAEQIYPNKQGANPWNELSSEKIIESLLDAGWTLQKIRSNPKYTKLIKIIEDRFGGK